ncbi:MAG TPA: GAF domain-containing protein, partial [Pseudolabrys sp.]
MKRRNTGRKRVKTSRRNAPRIARWAARRGADAAKDAAKKTAKKTAIARTARERDEALHQQAATAEILRLISASPTDAQPVFDAIVQSGLKIFPDAAIAIALPDGDKLRTAAFAATDPVRAKMWRKQWPIPLTRAYMHSLAFLDRKIVDVPDAREPPPEIAVGAKNLLPTGYRALTIVPLMRGRSAIGTLSVARLAPGRLTGSQFSLFKTFANQAVIAIENTRVLGELRQRTDDLSESLEQQTATSEVLQVISSSPGEVEAVFNSILDNAVRICSARFGNLTLFDGTNMRVVAMHNAPPEFEKIRRKNPVIAAEGTTLGTLVRTRQKLHIIDLASEKAYAKSPLVTAAGARSMLAVPMLKEGELIGAINIYRQDVRSFSDKQMALLENFAAQAVIAIENARLLNELRESLEQQTATSEVLGVISSSVTDAQPVFDMIAESAAKLCEAQYCFVYRFDGELLHFMAHRGVAQKVLDINRRNYPAPPSRGTVASRAILERRVVQIPEIAADPEYRISEMAALAGYRSAAAVPILRGGEPVGVIAVTRAQAGLLPDRQVELLKTFADQAVIAIENTRLFEAEQNRAAELSESLEQQTATSEVLKVISSTPGELEPVFQAILENATHICSANFGNLWLCNQDGFQVAASHGIPAAYRERLQPNDLVHPGPELPIARAASTRQAVHIPDLRADPSYLAGEPVALDGVQLGKIRTLLVVPMLRDQQVVGVLAIYRQEILPFTDKQIELLQNFAAQAVIAIENARLLNELRESLERQTATSEVLQIISSSPGELGPVFKAMLENTLRICEAKFGQMFLCEHDGVRLVSHIGVPAALAQFDEGRGAFQPVRGGPLDYVIRAQQVIHVS